VYRDGAREESAEGMTRSGQGHCVLFAVSWKNYMLHEIIR